MLNFEKYVNAVSSADVQAAAKMVRSSTTRVLATLLPE
jgi:hypothetical protein